MPDVVALFLIGATFFVAGGVKGMIGFGLPTVSVGVLATCFDVPTAMALLLVPSLLTNLWQATHGGHARALVQRIWLFLLGAGGSIWVGAILLTSVNTAYLTMSLGAVVVVYCLLHFMGCPCNVQSDHEQTIGLILGIVNGILTGMTGSFVVPGVMFLQAIGLPRNMLVQAMGMLFSVSTLGLAIALQKSRLLTMELGVLSILAVVPAGAGMLLGQRIRDSLPKERFTKGFFFALLILGVGIMGKGVFTLGRP
ncbi:MAG: hypothetical protein CSA33_07845 [Desulfobulbus propionicus]|nr:MAG: hypothetical protein CSA33_07845 [Desulfobulbus propionicus]